MEQIPVIDVSPFTSGDPSGKEDVARQLSTACEHTGFFCITGHGVDESLIGQTRQAGADFFAKPMTEKSKILRAADRTGRGYYPPADRALAKTLGVDTPPDLQEAWVMSPEAVPETHYFRNDTANYFFGPNLWPEGMPGFRETMLAYFEAMAGLGRHMMAGLALALSLDEDFFIDKFDKATNQFRIIHYPPQNTRPRPGQLRAGAHTDYGALTMLRGDDVPRDVADQGAESRVDRCPTTTQRFRLQPRGRDGEVDRRALGVDSAQGRKSTVGPYRWSHDPGVLSSTELRHPARGPRRHQRRASYHGRALRPEDPCCRRHYNSGRSIRQQLRKP